MCFVTDTVHHSSAKSLSTSTYDIPLYPDVRMKNLPFYEVLDVIVKPTNLCKMPDYRCLAVSSLAMVAGSLYFVVFFAFIKDINFCHYI